MKELLKTTQYLLLLLLVACGGGSGGSDTGGGTTNPPPPPAGPPAPIPSSFYSDASNSLPASRTQDCFDAAAHDIDLDGDLDLVLANANGSNLIYINDGSGVFVDESNTRLPSVDGISEHITMGDLDGDGDQDLIFANVVTNGKAGHEFYFNDGNGSFSDESSSNSFNSLASFISANDFDNDGDLDLFLSTFGQSQMLINDGNGGFSDVSNDRLPSDSQITEDSIIYDINNDGSLDILISQRGQNDGEGVRNRAWINDGLGTFTDETDTRLPTIVNSTFDAVLVDVDNDGDQDLINANASVVSNGAPLLDHLFLNNGNGVFSDVTNQNWPQDLTNSFGISPIDIDGDSDFDLLVAEWAYDGNGNLGRVRAYQNDGIGNFSNQTNSLLGDVRGNVVDIEVADFNGDGKQDLYFCASGQQGGGAEQGATDYMFLGQ